MLDLIIAIALTIGLFLMLCLTLIYDGLGKDWMMDEELTEEGLKDDEKKD